METGVVRTSSCPIFFAEQALTKRCSGPPGRSDRDAHERVDPRTPPLLPPPERTRRNRNGDSSPVDADTKVTREELIPRLYVLVLLGGVGLVDLVRFELTTSSMPWKRAPNCATGPDFSTIP